MPPHRQNARSAPRNPKHLQQSPFSHALPSPLFFRAAELPADAAYPHHQHHWGEFVYAFRGVMEVEVQQHHYLVPPQCGLWLPPNVAHRGLNRHAVHFSSLYVSQELTTGLPRTVCALRVSPLLRALLDELRQQGAPVPHTAATSRLLQVALDQIGQARQAGSYLPSSDDALLAPVIEALMADPGDTRTVAQWAATVHTTERTLMRRAHSELGMPLAQWRQRLRVVKAMPLLLAGETVENIAHDLGYASSSAFIAMFRGLAGVTPDEYRRSGAHTAP
jgi:AraC-like DNA-binding protein